MDKIERKAKVQFKKIGTPQTGDILKSTARDMAISLKNISQDILPFFSETAKSLITDYSAEEALCRCLALISGYTKEFKQRSLLCSMEGFITYIIRVQNEFRSIGYIWNIIRKQFPESFVDGIKGMKAVQDRRGAVFDIPESAKKEMEDMIAKWNEDPNQKKFFTISKADVLPELYEPTPTEAFHKSSPERSRNESGKPLPKGEIYKMKKELEFFMGGLPYDLSEEELSSFLAKNQVRFERINMVKDQAKNSFKGIAFVLCSDKESTQRIQTLNNQKFESRILKVNLASDKPKK